MKKNASLPDCIISDVMMPEMDGFELLEKVKSDSQLSRVPFIILSALAGHEDKLRGLRMGVDDYLAKPFDLDELKLRLDKLISRNRRKSAVRTDGKPSAYSQKWLEQLEHLVLENMRRPDFTITSLANELHISASQLHRRIKDITGLTPNRYIREIRLCRARDLLEGGEVGTLAELSHSSGFKDPQYFSRLFCERFGYRPIGRLK
jgi:YesN/AraC family two-component response regulator